MSGNGLKQPKLKLVGVKKHFGKKAVLDGIDLSVDQNGRVSWKIGRIDQPDSGWLLPFFIVTKKFPVKIGKNLYFAFQSKFFLKPFLYFKRNQTKQIAI